MFSSAGPFPWRRFQDYIAPDADRFAILVELLDEANLPFQVLPTGPARHFFVFPNGGSPAEGGTIITAHYDRAPESPGANDNSAADFMLLESALRLEKAGIRDWLFILTDHEEIETGGSLRDQGACLLGAAFPSLAKRRIYSFDCCGIGDSVVLSTTLDTLAERSLRGSLHAAIAANRERALLAARRLGMGQLLLAPTPFSDDAGFFRAGIAAQTVTTLPQAESNRLSVLARRDPLLAKSLIGQPLDMVESERNPALPRLPDTWRAFNGPDDSLRRLTPEHFRMVERFAEALCGR